MERLLVAWQEQALVGAEVLDERVRGVAILHKAHNAVMHSSPRRCVFAAPLLTYRLNDGILDLPVAVLLHPGVPDDRSSSLLGCL